MQLGQLTVSDTGIGIPDSELPQVTDWLFRGRQASAMATGSGNGLAIVAEFVKAHHGDLRIASQPRHSTSVTIAIPAHVKPAGSGPETA